MTELTWVYSPVYVDEPCQYVRTANHLLGAGTFFLHQNARADVVAVTDAAGAVVERRLYDDYGRSFDGVTRQPIAGSSVGNPYGFQGRRLDPETGLLYFRARYYDPKTGRFVQRDPIWDPGNLGNQYSFVGNSPVSRFDPFGDLGWLSKIMSKGGKVAAKAAVRASYDRMMKRYRKKLTKDQKERLGQGFKDLMDMFESPNSSLLFKLLSWGLPVGMARLAAVAKPIECRLRDLQRQASLMDKVNKVRKANRAKQAKGKKNNAFSMKDRLALGALWVGVTKMSRAQRELLAAGVQSAISGLV